MPASSQAPSVSPNLHVNRKWVTHKGPQICLRTWIWKSVCLFQSLTNKAGTFQRWTTFSDGNQKWTGFLISTWWGTIGERIGPQKRSNSPNTIPTDDVCLDCSENCWEEPALFPSKPLICNYKAVSPKERGALMTCLITKPQKAT